MCFQSNGLFMINLSGSTQVRSAQAGSLPDSPNPRNVCTQTVQPHVSQSWGTREVRRGK